MSYRRAFASLLWVTLIAAPLAVASRSAVAVLPSGAEFGVELAVSEKERSRGYMFRDEVGPREGMLFLFETTGHHAFWMKNCRVALDIVWLDEAFRVVHIAHGQKPCPEAGPCPQILPIKAARYVLEVAGGTAKRENLQSGDRIVILTEGSLP